LGEDVLAGSTAVAAWFGALDAAALAAMGLTMGSSAAEEGGAGVTWIGDAEEGGDTAVVGLSDPLVCVEAIESEVPPERAAKNASPPMSSAPARLAGRSQARRARAGPPGRVVLVASAVCA